MGGGARAVGGGEIEGERELASRGVGNLLVDRLFVSGKESAEGGQAEVEHSGIAARVAGSSEKASRCSVEMRPVFLVWAYAEGGVGCGEI